MKKLTKTFALICCTIYVDFGADDTSKRHKHLCKLRITKFLWQVIDEEVASFWSFIITKQFSSTGNNFKTTSKNILRRNMCTTQTIQRCKNTCTRTHSAQTHILMPTAYPKSMPAKALIQPLPMTALPLGAFYVLTCGLGWAFISSCKSLHSLEMHWFTSMSAVAACPLCLKYSAGAGHFIRGKGVCAYTQHKWILSQATTNT